MTADDTATWDRGGHRPPHSRAVSLFDDGFHTAVGVDWAAKIPPTILRMSTQATTQQAALQHPSRVSLRANVGQVLCVIVPPIIWFAPLDIEAGAKHALAITSFMLLAWITEAMDYAVAG